MRRLAAFAATTDGFALAERDLELRSEGFGPVAVVVDPTMPGGVAHVAAFDAREVRDRLGRPVLPNFHAAIAFWDRCLSQAEAAFGEARASRG